MKEQRFEKVVEWKDDKETENPILWLIVFTSSLIMIEIVIANSYWKPMNESTSYVFWLMGGWWFLIVFIIFGIYICLKQRKVYWRKVK